MKKPRDKRKRDKARQERAATKWLDVYQAKHGAAPTPEVRRAVEHAEAEARELGR